MNPSAQLPCGDSTPCDCLCLRISWVSLELSSLYKNHSLYKDPKPQPIGHPRFPSTVQGDPDVPFGRYRHLQKGSCPACLASFSNAPAPSVCILHSKEMQKHKPAVSKKNMQRKSTRLKRNNRSGKAWQDSVKEVEKLGEPARTFSVGSHVDRKVVTAGLPPWQSGTNTLTPRTILL